MRVIIAAAGTGGHIYPGITIANKIKQEEKDSKIIFLGTTRGLENDLVPRAGYSLKTISAYGLSKQISISNTKKLLKTFKGFIEANRIVKEFKPDIIIGTGGYICGAAAIAASINNVPFVLHESNAFPGKAVKFTAKKAKAVMVSFEEAISRIKNCKNVFYTGTPVKIKKQEYGINEKLSIIRNMGLSETKPIVLVFGGSQGAKKINETLIGIIEKSINKKYQIYWATGPKQYDNIKLELESKKININNIPNCKVVPYIYNMEELENVSDLIVARSGAMTITEIANLAKPSILIPIPNVSGDHQMYNAKVLEKIGAAKIIKNQDLTSGVLHNIIEDIVLNKSKCLEMGKNAYKIATLNVEDKIYDVIKNSLKK